jgi:hypothetical protein
MVLVEIGQLQQRCAEVQKHHIFGLFKCPISTKTISGVSSDEENPIYFCVYYNSLLS